MNFNDIWNDKAPNSMSRYANSAIKSGKIVKKNPDNISNTRGNVNASLLRQRLGNLNVEKNSYVNNTTLKEVKSTQALTLTTSQRLFSQSKDFDFGIKNRSSAKNMTNHMTTNHITKNPMSPN